MSIWTIADLHLSFCVDKPMNIFGENWDNYEDKVKQDWLSKVKEEDTVILSGDFSWGTYLEETTADFRFINDLPGTKILLKGNHDYWWQTIKSMDKFLKENSFENIYFLHNNSYFVDNKIIVGTRGWNFDFNDSDFERIYERELIRLELSIKDGIQKYGEDKEIICFVHYPPITKNMIENGIKSKYLEILNKYNISRLYYGHLHGASLKEAVEGYIDGVELKLVSSDYLKFELLKVI